MIKEGNKDTITIIDNCPFCGKEYTYDLPTEGYDRWFHGELVQVAFPNISPTVREHLISHLCVDCQKQVFGEDDD